MDILRSFLPEGVNPKELFNTLIAFMHQTVEHQRKIEEQQTEILRRLKELEDARVLDGNNA